MSDARAREAAVDAQACQRAAEVGRGGARQPGDLRGDAVDDGAHQLLARGRERETGEHAARRRAPERRGEAGESRARRPRPPASGAAPPSRSRSRGSVDRGRRRCSQLDAPRRPCRPGRRGSRSSRRRAARRRRRPAPPPSAAARGRRWRAGRRRCRTCTSPRRRARQPSPNSAACWSTARPVTGSGSPNAVGLADRAGARHDRRQRLGVDREERRTPRATTPRRRGRAAACATPSRRR